MIILSVTPCNFRNLRNNKIEFNQGITGIIGKNGKGKSSIIEAIQFALCGKTYATKEEALTIGEDSGYVKLEFSLNDKVGEIIRHLDINLVNLTYDGVTLKKTTEINELWNKLIQINPEIIQRVLIARQGDIPLLFSGDSDVRERIFQKIFLVPNTEKIRGMIFRNYIKQCPMAIPVEDEASLQAQLKSEETKISQFKKQLRGLNPLTLEEEKNLRNRLQFLLRCKDDSKIAQTLQKTLNEITVKEAELSTELEELKTLICGLHDNDVTARYEDLSSLREKDLFKKKLLSTLQLVDLPFSEELYVQYSSNKVTLLRVIEAYKEELIKARVAVNSYDAQLEKPGICPTCGTDMCIDYESLQQERLELLKITEDINMKLGNHEQELATLNKKCNSYEAAVTKRKQYEEVEAQVESVAFKEEEFEEVKVLNEMLKDLELRQYSAIQERKNLWASQNTLEIQINQLANYDGNSSPEQECVEIGDLLARDVEVKRERATKEVLLKLAETAQADLKERLKIVEVNIEKNKTRNKYLNILNTVYEGLHSSCFPRQLILSYAETLTDYLRASLARFNIPYRVTVKDDFSIEVKTTSGLVVPSVSGGQQIQIGLALHTALHDLFSQSFPLMIIDEGTTHLDADNRKNYFDIIVHLKKHNKLKQIIIIDHDPQLSEVVDHTIVLE